MIVPHTPRTWYAIGTAFTAVIAIVYTAFSLTGTPIHIFSATGLWALAIVSLPPALNPRYRLFAPWSFVILSVLVGLTFRGLYISHGHPDQETIDRLFLLEQDPAFFFTPALILLTGLLLMAVGYLWNPWKPKASPV